MIRKSDITRKERGSAKRLKSKYRWLESLLIQDLITKVQNTNISVVARELNVPHYVLRGHLERNGFIQINFKRPEGSWCKGLTKETSSIIKEASEKISSTRLEMFEHGELLRPDSYMTDEQLKLRHEKSLQTRLNKYGNRFGNTGWNKGLTKEDNPSIALAAKKTSKTRKRKIASGEIDIWKAIKACHFEGTKIENAVEETLKINNLSFTKQELLFNKFLVDFVDQVNKIVIFTDGCYFHACEEHRPKELKSWKKRKQIDASQTAYLTKCGYTVFRFWEHEIKSNVSKCVQQVADYINSLKK